MTSDLGSMPLEALMRQTPLAIAATDVTGRLTLFSPALQRMMRRPFKAITPDQMVTEFDLYAADGTTRLCPQDVPLARALAGEVVIDAVVATQVDGERLVFLRCNASPLFGDAGEIVGAVALVQDITADRLAAQDQDELRERLVVTINHELRTPLAKIIGHAEMLQDHPETSPERVRGSIDVIAGAAADLLRLAGVLSDLAELEEGTRLAKTHGNIAGLVRDVAARFTTRAAARDVELLVVAPPRVTATIDPRRAERAIEALLDNAVTYAPTATTIEVEVADLDGDVSISIRDAGTGIPDDERERLVKPFERGDHAWQPVNSRGLGLAVASTVTAAHGGSLVLGRLEPTGFGVTIRLPRHDAPSAPRRPAAG